MTELKADGSAGAASSVAVRPVQLSDQLKPAAVHALNVSELRKDIDAFCARHKLPRCQSALQRDLCVLSAGLRSAVLLDVAVSGTRLQSLLLAVRKSHPALRPLCALVLDEQGVFCCHREHLQERLAAQVQNKLSDIVLVDVAVERKDGPALCDAKAVSAYAYCFAAVAAAIQRAPADASLIAVPGSALGCSLTAVAGWLLEYPVVYVHGSTPSAGDQNDNCLGSRSLDVHEVTAALLDGSSEGKASAGSSDSSGGGSTVLFSFSLPTALAKQCAAVVEAFAKSLAARAASQQVWSSAQVKLRDRVTMSKVAM